MYYETIKTETIDGFDITFSVGPEDMAPDWDFETDADRDELLRKIENGTFLWFVAKVTASKNGIELASDYLGGCCYESTDEFIEDAYYFDMVQNVISEAREAIVKLAA